MTQSSARTLDGRIMSWNQGAQRLFGYPAEEMIGIPITILIPPDRQNEERMILEKVAGGERVDHYETVRRRKDGGSVAISLTVSPVKNIEGRIIGASKIARDITERKQAEARENALITQLAQINRIATAGELSASIAHEVNQPIVGVVLMASAASLLLSRTCPTFQRPVTFWRTSWMPLITQARSLPAFRRCSRRARITGFRLTSRS